MGLTGRSYFVQFGCLQAVLSVNASDTLEFSGIIVPIARTSVRQKNRFRTICVIISGLLVLGPS